MAGAGGMLGLAFHEEFKSEYELKCSDIDVNEDWLNFVDIRDFNDYENDFKNF